MWYSRKAYLDRLCLELCTDEYTHHLKKSRSPTTAAVQLRRHVRQTIHFSLTQQGRRCVLRIDSSSGGASACASSPSGQKRPTGHPLRKAPRAIAPASCGG